MARSPRAGARREVLKRVRNIRTTLDKLTKWWDVKSTVWLTWGERKSNGNVYERPREIHEYPEMQTNHWVATVNEIDEMIAQLTELRMFAVSEYHKVKEF